MASNPPHLTDSPPNDSLGEVREQLAAEFAGVFSPETVGDFVSESVALFAGPGVTEFLPRLVHRYARDLLESLARCRGFLSRARTEVLFVCVQNAGRSQIAAALLAHRSEAQPVTVRCAGTDPARELHVGVEEVMAEIGVPMAEAYPKPLHRQLVEAADVIITMGCGDACPIVPGRVYENWDLPDPVGMSLDELRRLREEIDGHVRALLLRLNRMASGAE